MPRSATTSIDSRPVDYWSLAHQPLACLVFLTPLLFIYEAGVIVLGDGQPAAVRNGADYWMRVCLGWAGVTWMPILPAIVLGFLLIRHLNCRHPWTVDGLTLAGMAAESVLFAFVLLAIGRGHEFVFRDALPDSSLTAVMPRCSWPI